MAESDQQSHPEVTKIDEQRLKYLGFIHVAAFQALVYFSYLYTLAKNRSGPLKPGVQNVEEMVKAVVGPVYNKYQRFPVDLLKFVDQKVDQSMSQLNQRAPPAVKQVSAQAVSVAQRAPEMARTVVSGVQRSGVIDTASGLAKTVYTKYEPTAKGLYVRYEPVAEEYAVSAWSSLQRLPMFPQVAKVMVPTAAFCSEKYNETVRSSADKGYTVASYLPLVPVERIAKVFQGNAVEKEEPFPTPRAEDAVLPAH